MFRRHRLAFLAPTFVTEKHAGGMASYLDRMTRALVEAGHEPEVFVLSEHEPGVLDHRGVRVMRVSRETRRMRWVKGMMRLGPLRGWGVAMELLSGAAQLGAAFERRDGEQPFDMVQSSDYMATGRYVKPCAGRPHVVRCSVARELMAEVDRGDSARMRRWWGKYELEEVRRAEIAYAPSAYVAAYYRRRLEREVAVVRPPEYFAEMAGAEEVAGLPERYLLHFGQLRACKGTMWLLDALPLAWEREPGLQVVLAGPVRDSGLGRRLAGLRGVEKRLVMLEMLPRAQMYGVLRGAAATVLPSLADNLPNTVIESLGMGIPVIGSRGASIDELVEDGVHGELVDPGDVAGLARALVRAWRGESVGRGFAWDSAVARMMRPDRAVEALGRIAGLDLVTQDVGDRAVQSAGQK